MANNLRSERLVYRAIEDNEADNAFFHTLLSDTQSFLKYDSRIMSFKPVSRKDSERYKREHSDKILSVIICLPVEKTDGAGKPAVDLKPIGIVGLDKLWEEKIHHRFSEIFVFIKEGEQGKGYGSEAIEWTLKWGFEMRGLHRVGIGYMTWNPGAGRLYERLGFKEEGRTRETYWMGGKWWDHVELGMLEDEWRAREEEKKHTGGQGEKLQQFEPIVFPADFR